MPDVTDQSHYLSVLAQTPPAHLKEFTETILAQIDDVQVLQNRTGLVMLPYTDSVQGTPFHLGEVLMSEAHVRVNGQEGYGACTGRDLEQSLAIAILDAIMQQATPSAPKGLPSLPAGREHVTPPPRPVGTRGEARRGLITSLQTAITNFVAAQAQAQQDADLELLRKVEATRVEMEVF